MKNRIQALQYLLIQHIFLNVYSYKVTWKWEIENLEVINIYSYTSIKMFFIINLKSIYVYVPYSKFLLFKWIFTLSFQ